MKKSTVMMLGTVSSAIVLAACGGVEAGSNDQVIIYSNADDEAIDVMEATLDNKGYKGKYLIQSFGTSELGGKIMAEGKDIEADVVTTASYFIESAQKSKSMFVDVSSDLKPLDDGSTFALPILGNSGSIFINTDLLKQKGLPVPTSIKDLTNPAYKDLLSFPNILDSSTGWLLVQAIINEYGEKEGKELLADLIKNAGPHIESSGSGPIKKVKTGEVAVGFGLRIQAIDAKKEGIPIDYIDPIEGNFTLTESVAVVDKEGDEALAHEIAKVIATEARPDLLKQYPVALYEGEQVNEEYVPKHLKKWDTTLTVDLLEKHQAFFKEAQK
ncbi:ABC transporter substrate-binding protein [Lysinibacillus sp. KCTC 33748]|uniref:extracellular solute-binding protein n=1 Tax=unclassified Lysinibacillus TaxID=2636778 RepID=UPI0009A58CE2|nr:MULTISPECIES: extracellular solute-binding protein [unclassified Lysinibacillus]OXS77243.1 ABC transporter substrate-binding protein [Lysinibacillus sp. KCTC 33748]SKB32136.1 iron(III) transport system substrate-binding protein [Lysinibacillus sp. AC-3]